jgi:hypothetical protein
MPLDPPETALVPVPASSVVSALSVYVEPLVADARVAVIGDVELGLHLRLLELGARTVHLYDPDPERVARVADEVPRGVSVRMLRDDFDVRDGAFDLVVIPDIALLPDAAASVVRLRRVIDPRGAVVAMGRARAPSADDTVFPELEPAVVEYAELYDIFALQFESVTMTGVLPFTGVVFAELGAGDDLAVSVDTRLVAPDPPGVFVVVAGREAPLLDSYAIVQVEREIQTFDTVTVAFKGAARLPDANDVRSQDVAAAFAALQLKAALLATQLEEHRARLALLETRNAEDAGRVEQIVLERDVALTRAAELEGILATAQQALGSLEARLVFAEQGTLERDDQIAALNAELDARTSAAEELTTESVDPALIAEILARAERAETSLASHVADLAHVSEAHASETSGLEEQLRERARVITAMEKELGRREQLVRELVASLEDAREGHGVPVAFEAAPAAPGVAPEEVARLRRKLDELAFEVARREGELVAQAWRIAELENEKARLVAKTTARSGAAQKDSASAPTLPGREVERELSRARDELDALRQALRQEHAARVAAESGEELSRARAELARQAALLEQMRGRGTHPEG